MEELWKDIVELDGYQVSNLGRVRSKERAVLRSDGQVAHYDGKELKQFKSGRNRNAMQVLIRRDGKLTAFKVHRLVGMAFLENPYNLPVIDHIDRNPFNNNVTNLRWASYSLNAKNTGIVGRSSVAEKHISWCKERKKFRLTIITDSVTIVNARYDTLEEAKAERMRLVGF